MKNPTSKYDALIAELRKRSDELGEVIAALREVRERPERPVKVPQRRGRKSMGEEERKVVSARMKTYWAERRRSRG